MGVLMWRIVVIGLVITRLLVNLILVLVVLGVLICGLSLGFLKLCVRLIGLLSCLVLVVVLIL